MLHRFQDVDARDKRGHDELRVLRIGIIGFARERLMLNKLMSALKGTFNPYA